MKRPIIVICIIAAISLIVFYGIQNRIPVVEVALAEKGPALDAVSGNVEVLPLLETTVKSDRNGIVESVIQMPADAVLPIKVGDTLAQLNTELVDSEIALAKLQLEAAQARLEAPTEFDLQRSRLEEELESLTSLKSSGRVSETEVTRTQAEIDRLIVLGRTEVTRREQEVALRKNYLDQRELWKRQHTIVAPTAGTLNAVFVFPGDIVNPGSKIAKLHTKELLIRISVREEDFLGISSGNPVRLRFLGFGENEFIGKVSGLSPTANADSRQRDVFVSLNDTPKGLVSGMTGQAVIIKAERLETITVPRRALVGNYIYVVNKSKVELREVQTGFVGLDVAEIVSGIEVGEQVIVDRPHIYRDSETVRPILN